MALRSLEDKAALCREMARRSGAAGRGLTSAGFSARAEEASSAALLLRRLLTAGAADAPTADGAAGISA
jgi:hypothetical protein